MSETVTTILPDASAQARQLKRRPAVMRKARRVLPMHLLLLSIALVTAFPFYAMVVISLQPGQPIQMPQALFPGSISFDAFVETLSSRNIPRWTLNSAIYSIVSTVFVLLFASMSGYAFAKKKFPGRELIFWVLVAMLMIPYHLTIIPQYILVGDMGGLNTMWGMLAPTLANTSAMFLMRQFIHGIPDELLDAAKIDGAGEFRIYWSIVLPQTKPILATLATFVFLAHWNDFLWPMISQQSSENHVLTVGLNTLQEEQVPLATIMAAAVISFIPTFLVFIFFQRYFVRGVMMSGLK